MNIVSIYIDMYIKDYASDELNLYIVRNILSVSEFIKDAKINIHIFNRIANKNINDINSLKKLMKAINENIGDAVFKTI